MIDTLPYGSGINHKTGVQTILGAGGVIGEELTHELASFARVIRRVRRHPGRNQEAKAADLLNADQVAEAVRGSDVAYLVAGLAYNTAAWQAEWPVIMRNVIFACRRHCVRLVFFDNVYLYGRVNGVMTEDTPANPCSKKGEVRAQIAGILMSEIQAGNLQGLIARAADFYGPGATNTFVQPMVFEKLRDGSKAAWLCNDGIAHSMTFTPDAGRATALLGNTEDAYGQVWHLPTHPDAPTGRQFIHMVAEELQAKPSYRVLRPWTLKLAGLFNAAVRESIELLYQNQEPYIVDSSRFNRRFFPPTPYREGIRQTARCMIR